MPADRRPVPSGDMDAALLRSLQALSEPSRLRLLGLLAEHSMTAPELAAALGLSPRTVGHHLARLGEAGLVEESPSGGTARYALRASRLREMGRELEAIGQPGSEDADGSGPEAVPPVSADGRSRTAEERKILRAFLEDGRLTTIPAQDRKKLVVLRYLAETAFPEDRDYPEKEVNQRLGLVHPDVAALRRYLVDNRFMSRAAGIYRLRPRKDWPDQGD
jgi:DNA-binding transcriptional ArsR family regulator